MKKYLKESLKASNGITLIALVITIIILLILAGISISMLAGDNSILQKATQSKELTEKATVIELAQTEILGQIAENKGKTISDTQLKAILSKYFEEFDDELSEDLSETTITLTAKKEYGGYTNIALADIYNGKISKNASTTDESATILAALENANFWDDVQYKSSIRISEKLTAKFYDDNFNGEGYIECNGIIYKLIYSTDNGDINSVIKTDIDVSTLGLKLKGEQLYGSDMVTIVRGTLVFTGREGYPYGTYIAYLFNLDDGYAYEFTDEGVLVYRDLQYDG